MVVYKESKDERPMWLSAGHILVADLQLAGVKCVHGRGLTLLSTRYAKS